jgi:hypothetical protein
MAKKAATEKVIYYSCKNCINAIYEQYENIWFCIIKSEANDWKEKGIFQSKDCKDSFVQITEFRKRRSFNHQ